MATILHVSYYEGLLVSRHILLQREGHDVVSALGNEQAMTLAMTKKFDVAVVGFSSEEDKRRAIIKWLKQHVPETRVVALLWSSAEHLPEADYETLCEDPSSWLKVVAQSAAI